MQVIRRLHTREHLLIKSQTVGDLRSPQSLNTRVTPSVQFYAGMVTR